jgi:hypothetical protein
MIPPNWFPHRRDDGELVGWIHESGEDWIAIDVLGRSASDPTDWLSAEEALERVGLAFLADPWMLDCEGERPVRVRIVEVTPGDGAEDSGRIVVKIDDFGDVTGGLGTRFTLPWPIPSRLRPPRDGDPDGFTIG